MLLFILYLVLAFIVIYILWHVMSKRQSLPCPTWLSWLVEVDNPLAKAHKANNILIAANIQPGMTVLDAGCGPGRITLPAALKVGSEGKVIALDLQAGMLDKIKTKAAKAQLPNIICIEGGLGTGKLPKHFADRALLVCVLGEIVERAKALDEIYSALKPKGTLSITESIFDPHYQRKLTVIKLAKSIGFKEISCTGNFLAYTISFEKL